MKTIKLIGSLDLDLLKLNLKEGDIVSARPDPNSKVGAMWFQVEHTDCVVWPQNYVIISTCSWCGKQFEGKGFLKKSNSSKTFCSDACHSSDYEQYHDNFMSDADPGL